MSPGKSPSRIRSWRKRALHRVHRDVPHHDVLRHDAPRLRALHLHALRHDRRDAHLHDRRVHQEAQHERECRRLWCCRCKKGRHNPSRRSLKGPVDERSTRSQS